MTKRLIAAQMRQWPDSVILTPQEVIEWAAAENCDMRFRAVAMAIQYPEGVWYRLPGMGEVTGFRYGVPGYKYLSGFSDL